MSVHNVSSAISYISQKQATVFFPDEKETKAASATALIEKIQTDLELAPWGEDNRFPQNIANQIGKGSPMMASLNIKAKSLWGNGIVYGTMKNSQFVKAERGLFPMVDKFFYENDLARFYAELNLDYVYFANCFPELIFDNKHENIVRLIHQESCDCRFKQMNDEGDIDRVYISKLWGAAKDQYVQFDPKKQLKELTYSGKEIMSKVDNKFIKERRALDKYFPLDGLKDAAGQKEKSVILPIDYPSPNKTYYQLAHWDAVRQSGWIDVATLVPNMLRTMYGNAFTIKYHIEIPDTYLAKRIDKWNELTPEKKKKEKETLLESLDKFLSGTDNTHKSLITFFSSSPDGKDEERVKITPIESKSNIDKDLLTSGTANSELLFALEMNPNMIGAGKAGGVFSSNQGGSNIREAKTAHDMLLNLDRHMTLAPLRVIQRFNKWPEEIVFRHEDIEMTTLDKGKETIAKTS